MVWAKGGPAPFPKCDEAGAEFDMPTTPVLNHLHI